MTAPVSATSNEILGARLLREIAVEEGSLEELLKDLRTAHRPQPSRSGIPELDSLWRSHGGKLAVTGRGLPLLYYLVNHIVTVRGGTIAIVDVEGRFSPSHLDCELRHVHIFRPTKSNLKVTLESVEGYMLWGDHTSKDRVWFGTVVNGGVGGDIMAGWRGWLRVEREEVGGHPLGLSVEEALLERSMSQESIESKGWKATSEFGGFNWR